MCFLCIEQVSGLARMYTKNRSSSMSLSLRQNHQIAVKFPQRRSPKQSGGRRVGNSDGPIVGLNQEVGGVDRALYGRWDTAGEWGSCTSCFCSRTRLEYLAFLGPRLVS